MAETDGMSRIIYVEPNDSLDYIDGVPITPDYSDLCIAFNLIVEIVPRFKTNAAQGTDLSEEHCIFWRSRAPIDGKQYSEGNYVSFLKGEKGFLTTFYTDTNYEDIVKKNIVEGLGVENVTVAFENYYTPTVSIKFVDQRGSSLFGREEATHNDDKLTIDNIFGAFFTAPYPKFKLQIKGFYGQAVTFQLTCSGFKGNLNPQTGNFEATATFIGYSYSLLTDIPFQYIVAAPWCGYEGRDYWIQNSNSPDWAFDDGSPMITIYDFMEKVNSSLTNDALLKIISDDDQEIINSGETETSIISEILTLFSRYRNALALSVSDSYVHNYQGADIEDEQMLIFSDSEKIEATDSVKSAWQNLADKVKEYNENYTEIPSSSMPNGIPVDGSQYEMCCFNIFHIDRDSDNKLLRVSFSEESGLRGKSTDVPENLMELKLNSNGNSQRVMSESLANVLATHLKSGEVTEKIKPYAFLIDLHDFRKRLNERVQYLKDETAGIEQSAERNYVELAKSNLGVVPYIGNIFKMIMAHIDTFVHIMYRCFDRINQQAGNGQRDAEYLGINIARTDVVLKPDQKYVPAWPLVTKASAKLKSEYVAQEEESTIGWVGDVRSGVFEEEKLVRALFLACKKTSGDTFKNKEEETNVNYIPIMPSDINILANVFQGNREINLSTLAGMLGIRTAQIFGILEKDAIDNSIAKVMGRMDAYNYYLMCFSKSEINTNIIESCGNKSFTNKILDIMLCKPDEDCMGETQTNGQQNQAFERRPGVITASGRHPIYSENGTLLKYVHYYTKHRHALVPSTVQSFFVYDNRYTYVNDGDTPYFNYVHNNNHIVDTLVNCSTKYLWSELDEGKRFDIEKYTNTEMFNVEMNRSKVDGIIRRYDEMCSNNFKILGEQFEDDFGKVLERYWSVDDSAYKNTLENRINLATPKYADMGIDVKNMTYEDAKSVMATNISYKGNGEWGDGKTIDSIFIDSPRIGYAGGNGENIERCSLFGSYFYYMQNSITDLKTRNRVKALLFLHSLLNGTMVYKKAPRAFSNKSSGGIELINPAHALLLGGLLWRKYYKDGDTDAEPIIFKYEDDKASFNYKAVTKGTTLYYDTNKKDIGCRFCVFSANCQKSNNVAISKLFNGVDVDYNVEHVLMQKFEDFVDNEFQTIINKYELKPPQKDDSGGRLISPTRLFEFYKGREDSNTGTTNTETSSDNSNEIPKSKISALFGGFYDSYVYMYKTESLQTPFILYSKDDNDRAQDLLKWLFAGKSIIIDSTARVQSKGKTTEPAALSTDVTVQKANVTSYLDGFSEALSSIVGSVGESAIDNSDTESAQYGDIAEFDRDVAIPIYMYLKMVWDKWLVATDKLNPYDNEYTVRNFFKNFVFIDSFYRNIASRFMLNCGILLQRYSDNNMGTRDYSIFKYIGDITSDHHCMFLAVPDFIDDMGMDDNGKAKARDALADIFKPVPYESMRDMRLNNRFVIIYVPKLSETPSEINNYAEDGFNIWSYNEKDGVCPPILKATKANIEEITPYGYFVPSFGVAYGRQHNHLFKSINLNMETPIITSAVINTLSHIARMGASNEHAIAYVGQDIYPVYSNYSYICEFEMMGCAQIQPLMYFQLMNVPMWRGTYMIFSVTHTMSPGNMVTRVKAMKLSNRAVPFSNAWFKKNLNYNPKGNGNGADCGDGVYGADDSEYNGTLPERKYIDLKKVLASRNTNSYYNGSGTHRSLRKQDYQTPLRNDLTTGHAECTCGPQTFIQDGLKARAVNSKIPGNLRPRAWNDSVTKCMLGDYGFKVIAELDSISAIDNYKAQPCDIMTVFSDVNGHQHMCMWDGKNWVSDYVQRTAWPYHRSGYGIGKPPKEKPRVWRFDDNIWYKKYREYLD